MMNNNILKMIDQAFDKNKNKLLYLSPLIVINLIILILILYTPPHIINEFSDTNGYLGLANNIAFGRFFNTLPHNTYSLGAAFLYAPAFFFRNNTLRFISLYLIQLFFVNLSIFTFAKAYKKVKGEVPNKYLLAILLLSIGFLGQFFYIMTETIYTSFLILALSLLVQLFFSSKNSRKFPNFILPFSLGFISIFLGSIRETGIVFTLFISIALIYLVISKKLSTKTLMFFLLGMIIGFIPEIIQSFMSQKYPEYYSIPSIYTSSGISSYIQYFKTSLQSLGSIKHIFLPAIFRQYLLYSIFSLGSMLIIIPLIIQKILDNHNPFHNKSNKLFWAILIAFIIPTFLHFGQTIVHVWGYLQQTDITSTHMDRYLMPISTLTFALAILFSQKKQKFKPLLTIPFYILLLLSIAFPITFAVGPSISNRTFDFSIIEYILPSTNAYIYTLILVILSIISSILYYKREYKKLFYLVLILFGLSYMINQSYYIEVSNKNNPRTQIVENLDIEDNIKYVYLVYPSEIRVNEKIADYTYYFDYSRIFLTENVKYIGLVQEDIDTGLKEGVPGLIIYRQNRDLALPSECELKNKEISLNSRTYFVAKCF